MDKATWVYMLQCSDDSYDIGMSHDPDRREAEHNLGLSKHTFFRRPVTLVWCERFPTGAEAFAFERKIKGWTRAKKTALIRNDWEEIKRLSQSRSAPADPTKRRFPNRPAPLPPRSEP